jgi:Porphyromonas-type peptidyl-arginine deiminase
MRVIALSALVALAGFTSTVPARVRASEQMPDRDIPFSAAAPADDEWLFPGEYESHQAMWMLWPTYENKAGLPSTEVVSDVIEAMKNHTHVNLAVQDGADEAAARTFLMARRVALDHVHFFRLAHLDIWARDTGPQFTRSLTGNLRVTDWSFNFWGYEDPGSFNSRFDEDFDRRVARTLKVPVIGAARNSQTGVRFVHEGGSASHNGHGTMIAVESVVIQRNLGPNTFCGGEAPVTDLSQANTYAPHPDWPACRVLVENEYRRMLGARKVIWIPTGVIEDTGTFAVYSVRISACPNGRASLFHMLGSIRCSASTAILTSSFDSSAPTRSCSLRRRRQTGSRGLRSNGSRNGSIAGTKSDWSVPSTSSPRKPRNRVSPFRWSACRRRC